METTKLYYEDAYLREFDAAVLSCREEQGRYLVVLDRTAVDRETVGVPVIAVGVPTVIDGAALGSDTEAAPQGLYVTPRDIDRQVRQLGRLLGYGISLAVQPGLTAEDLAALAE